MGVRTKVTSALRRPVLGDALDQHGGHHQRAAFLVKPRGILDLRQFLPCGDLEPEQGFGAKLLLARGIEQIDPDHTGHLRKLGHARLDRDEPTVTHAKNPHHGQSPSDRTPRPAFTYAACPLRATFIRKVNATAARRQKWKPANHKILFPFCFT